MQTLSLIPTVTFGVMLCLLSPLPLHARTFYIAPPPLGDDQHTFTQAQSQATPWATLDKASQDMDSGDTAIVLPGTYTETLKPRHNFTKWKAEPPCHEGGAIIAPPTDQGVVIDGKDGIVIDGFCVAGGTTGVRFNATTGGVIRNTEISHPSFQCLTVQNSSDVVIEDNILESCGAMGLQYTDSERAVVRNNLVVNAHDWGISIQTGGQHLVQNNTVDRNGRGIRIQPGYGTVVNNIVTNSTGLGLKWEDPAVVENYNNAWGNGGANFDPPSGLSPGLQSFSADPLYVLPGYFLSQFPEQDETSPSVDTGDPNVVVPGTTSTGFLLDTPPSDMGIHYALPQTPLAEFRLTTARVHIRPNPTEGGFLADYHLGCTLALGAESDGINLKQESLTIKIDASSHILASRMCAGGARHNRIWTCHGQKSGVTSVHIDLEDGSCAIRARAIPVASSPLPPVVRVEIAIGGDTGSDELTYSAGTLLAP